MSIKTQALRRAGTPTVVSTRSRKLRIAIVSDAITGRNGVGTYYQDLLQQLEPYVESIELIGPSMESRSLELVSIRMPGDKTQRMSWPRRRLLETQLDRQQPNVIIIPSLGAFAYYALRHAQRRHIPIAVVNHTNFDQLIGLYFPTCVAAPCRHYLQRIYRWLLMQASGVAAMNSESLEDARKAGAQSVRVMGTPLATDYLEHPTQPVADRIEHAVYVGRLAKEKQIDHFIAAAKELPHIRFSIVGDGPQRQMAVAAAARLPNIEYLGWLDRQQVRTVIDDAQLLVLPSVLETFGTVALEALARHRFVLTSQNCGIAKWPSLAAGLFTIGESESVAQAMQRMVQMSPQSRVDHASRSWQAVRQFNQSTIRIWLSFLVDVASRQPLEPQGDSHLDPSTGVHS